MKIAVSCIVASTTTSLLLAPSCTAWSAALTLQSAAVRSRSSAGPTPLFTTTTTTTAGSSSSCKKQVKVVVEKVNTTTTTTTASVDADNDDDGLQRQRQQLVKDLRRHTEKALAGSDPQIALRDATAVLDDLHKAGQTAPTLAYNALLKAWKAHGSNKSMQHQQKHWSHAVTASTALLQDMQARRLADVTSYTTFISLLAVRGDGHQALQTLRNMPVPPNTRTYNAVLLAWVNAGKLNQAADLLHEMESNKATADDDDDDDAQVSTVSYAILMAGYGRNKQFDAVVDLWNRCHERYKNGNDRACRPNLHALTTLVTACAHRRSAEAAQLATNALLEFIKMSQELQQSSSSAKANVEIGDDDEKIEGEDSTAVNVLVVTSVIDCWQKSGAPQAGQQAEQLLRWLVTEFQTTGQESLRPNAYTFSTAIGAWARSRRFGKAQAAANLLEWMHELHNTGIVHDAPNVYCYTGVINAAAYSAKESPTAQRQALDTAVSTYKRMGQDQATHITYAAILMALRNLVPPSPKRTAAVTTVLQEAASRGQVCDLVVQRVQSAVSTTEATEILGDIPAYWQRNVARNLRP